MENMQDVNERIQAEGYTMRGFPKGGKTTWVNASKRHGIIVDENAGTFTAHTLSDIGELEGAPDAELMQLVNALEIIASVAIETGDDEPEPEAPATNAPEHISPAVPIAEPTPEAEAKPEPAKEENKDIPKQPSPKQTDGTDIKKIIDDIVGNDVLEIFGPTGSGKSKFSLYAAQEYVKAGKKVYYLDTERNLTKEDIDSLKGCIYQYTPDIKEIEKITQNLPKVDVVIIDSIGFPVLTTYARLNARQKGDALLKLIAIFGDLKLWAYHNKGVAIVTNQPESGFNKDKNHVLRPFGDKSQFAAKEIWWLKPGTQSEKLTSTSITAFRSRSMGRNTKIATLNVTNAGVEVV